MTPEGVSATVTAGAESRACTGASRTVPTDFGLWTLVAIWLDLAPSPPDSVGAAVRWALRLGSWGTDGCAGLSAGSEVASSCAGGEFPAPTDLGPSASLKGMFWALPSRWR